MSFYSVYAPDPPPLQDFCVAVNDTDFHVTINGNFCKNPNKVTSADFLFQGYNEPGDTNNRFGTAPVMTNVFRFPALNTLGISLGRVDFAPGGVNPLHFHPRASEMVTVLQGTLFAGFISGNLPGDINRLYSSVLHEGDIFVIPQSLIHFQINIGKKPAVANSAFGSQNPGRVDVNRAVFGSIPLIPDDVLTGTFQVNETIIEALRAQFMSYDD
ncbi:putative germin-like protein 2-1 [Silene latifolia]|uniref:putative germin-like protein 2-1 n=1 Tax=Silene latifolia TaxID=37657 RepID=UPI003D76CE37